MIEVEFGGATRVEEHEEGTEFQHLPFPATEAENKPNQRARAMELTRYFQRHGATERVDEAAFECPERRG